MNKNKIISVMPTVLFITGIAGIFVSEVMVARDTVKAKDILERHHIYKADEDHVDGLPTTKEYVKEVVKGTWKCYIPTLVSTTVTITSLLMSKRLTAKQIATLSTAAMSATGLVTRYRKEILDRTNEDVLSDIDRAVAEATLKEHKNVYVKTPHLMQAEDFDANEDDEYIFFDPLTKQKFRSTKLLTTSARYFLNRNFALAGLVSLETFYNFLGVDLPEEYRYMEWDMDKIMQDGDELPWIDIDFIRSTEPDPDTGEYYYIIEYNFDPGEIEDGPFLYPFGNPLDTEGAYVRN